MKNLEKLKIKLRSIFEENKNDITELELSDLADRLVGIGLSLIKMKGADNVL